MKRIAITGASGYIGKALVKRLLGQGYDISILTRLPNPDHLEKGINTVFGDLNNEDALKELTIDADVVGNLAGEVLNEERMFETNFIGVKKLFKQSISSRVKKFIQLSSVGVYGTVSGRVNEDHVLRPINYYEKSKAQADSWLQDHFNPYSNLIILRPSNVFGPNMPNEHLRDLIKKIKNRSYFFIGKEQVYVNYIYFENVIDAIEILIQDDKKYSKARIFNINCPNLLEEFIAKITEALKVNEINKRLPKMPVLVMVKILDGIANLSGMKFPLSMNRFRALTSSALFDSAKFLQTYNIESFKVSNEEGLAKCVSKWEMHAK